MGNEQHLLPFIRLLDAKSCVSIKMGDKMDLNDLISAFLVTRVGTSEINQHLLPNEVALSFADRYGGVPTKVYPRGEGQDVKKEKRSKWSRLGKMF